MALHPIMLLELSLRDAEAELKAAVDAPGHSTCEDRLIDSLQATHECLRGVLRTLEVLNPVFVSSSPRTMTGPAGTG